MDSKAVSIQSCKHCGAGAPSDAHFCPKCDKILSFVRHGDYFTFLGLPRKLEIDLKDLDVRLRTLSRQFHPDYYCNASPAERVASLERASYLNDAYRTLRDRSSRIEYLLKIEGVQVKRAGSGVVAPGGVSQELLEEVFELNEQLDAIREARAAGTADEDLRPRIDAAKQPIDRHVAEHESRLRNLIRQWDGLVERQASAAERRPVLESLKALLLEKTYMNNLLAGIEQV